MVRFSVFALAIGAATTLFTAAAAAQASCSSDGAPRPTALFERFISADCEACWADPATPAPSVPSTLVLDWIVPGTQGEDAPLAAAASRDGLLRLEELGRGVPTTTDVATASVLRGQHHSHQRTQPLRVAHGLPMNDYLGTGIALRATHAGRASTAGSWQYHLLLVESVPAGTEGTPVARNLVRNMLSGTWNEREQLSKSEQTRSRFAWMDNRPMRIPEGAKAEQLHMVGWVQNAQGEVVAAAQSVCR